MDQNKKVLTPEMLLKDKIGGAPMRGLRIVLECFFIGLFGLFILLFLGFIGFIIDVAVIVGYVIYKKNEKKKHLGAYFRILPLVGKNVFSTGNDEDDYNIYKGNFGPGPGGQDMWAEFGEFGEYEPAKPGDYYYVAFYPGNNKAFACYSYDRYVIDQRFEVR